MTAAWIDSRTCADYWDLDTIDLRTEFDVIVAGLTEEQTQTPDPEQRIVVLVELPQAPEPTMAELTYGCRFAVHVGDKVNCPPMPRWPKWQVGIVVRLDANGYHGPVKYVTPFAGGDEA